MNINDIELNIDKLKDRRYVEAIILIINAVKDYPERELEDVYEYLKNVKSLLGTNTITVNGLMDFIGSLSATEHDMWVEASLSSLAEAFNLMRLYEIEMDEMFVVMKSICK